MHTMCIGSLVVSYKAVISKRNFGQSILQRVSACIYMSNLVNKSVLHLWLLYLRNKACLTRHLGHPYSDANIKIKFLMQYYDCLFFGEFYVRSFLLLNSWNNDSLFWKFSLIVKKLRTSIKYVLLHMKLHTLVFLSFDFS